MPLDGAEKGPKLLCYSFLVYASLSLSLSSLLAVKARDPGYRRRRGPAAPFPGPAEPRTANRGITTSTTPRRPCKQQQGFCPNVQLNTREPRQLGHLALHPMATKSLPPGYRFHPTDVELTLFYLKRKLLGKHLPCNTITEIDLYKYSPWDLPGTGKASLESNDLALYFFCSRDRKYSCGLRTNRSTGVGYWKATGKERHVMFNSRTVGMRRTLVFHLAKAQRGPRTDWQRGDRTNWVMHEYRLEDEELAASGVKLDACVLCKIFQKRGPGPKFSEEDSEDPNVECSSFASPEAPFAPESSHGGFNSGGQHRAVNDDDNVSLRPLSESNREHAVRRVLHDRTSSPDIPFDSIHIQQLAEIISCSSTHLLCTVDEDASRPDSNADYDNDNEILLDDSETIFSGLDELALQPVERNCNHRNCLHAAVQ
ncbi:hypothetical protein ACP70R_010628 [Stipagrostis hirtigluma subsp. patula]